MFICLNSAGPSFRDILVTVISQFTNANFNMTFVDSMLRETKRKTHIENISRIQGRQQRKPDVIRL